MSSVKIQSIVSSQLPEFVREDYPVFVQFLKKYYEYLETVDARNIEDIRDIDKTLTEYIQYFNNELAFLNSPDFTKAQIDAVLYLRKSKQLFVSKGSEEAYKYLFRVLYGKESEMMYPWDYVLKTSDGKWKQDTSIFVNVLGGNVNTIVGNQISINNSGTQVKVIVDRVVHVKNNTYEVFVNKNFYGTVHVGDTISYGEFNAVVASTITGYSIEYSGNGYKVGDLITVTTISGNETINHVIKVTKVDSKGGIVRIKNVSFGTGYSDDFYFLALKQNQNVVAQSILSVAKDGVIQFPIPDDSSVNSYTEYAYVSKPTVWDTNYAEPTTAGEVVREFTVITPTNQPENVEYALIKFNVGAVARYQGYYVSTDGFLDDAIVLQDSKYYQKYSYQITVDEAISNYRSYILTMLHTAGMKLFSNYRIINEYKPQLSAEITVDIV